MSEKKSDGGSAFPLPAQPGAGGHDGELGMSLRHYYAGEAMKGMLANPGIRPADADKPYIAQLARDYADALIKVMGKL